MGEIICSDQHLTIREVAEEVRIAFGMCQKILTGDLQMRFVPRLLTAEQKDDRVTVCTDLHELAQNDSNFMFLVISGAECWVEGYDPETKHVLPVEDSIILTKESTAGEVQYKTMLIVFFYIDGLVHHECVPGGYRVNKEFYKRIQQRLRDTVRRHRPEKWHSGNWILHHDDALPHRAVTTNEFLAKHNIPSLQHLPYSPDLAP